MITMHKIFHKFIKLTFWWQKILIRFKQLNNHQSTLNFAKYNILNIILNEIFFSISTIFHTYKIMNNILKTKNEKFEFNSCSINDINSFITKNYYFKSLINLSENTARKHFNIICSNSQKEDIRNIFWIRKNYYEWKSIFGKQS